MKQALFVGCLAAMSVLGCGNKDGSGSGAAASGSGSAVSGSGTSVSGSGAAGAVPGASGTAIGCKSVGCGDDKGDFFEKCDCSGKKMGAPLTGKWNGTIDKFFKKPIFVVENTSERPIQWASAAVYYYDKAGKQLEVELKDRKEKFKSSTVNGSNFTLKPKEKKEISIGWSEENHPKDAVKLEVVFDGWCYGVDGDKATELCIKIDRAPVDRPAAN